MQSLNNQSNVPLRGNGIYIGSWDDILQYQNIQINLKASQNCQIIYYESNDKVLINTTNYNYVADSVYFNSINSTSRYVYFTVRNTTSVDQVSFNFSIIYKQSPTSNSVVGSDVNIISPVNGSGNVLVDISGQTVDISGQSVDISGQTVDINGQSVDISGQTVDISGQTVIVDISGQTVLVTNTVNTDVYGLLNNQRLSSQVWAGVSVAQNETSSAITPSLSSYCNTVLSCYGSSTESAVIAVQFSNDTTTFYTTQYQYTLSAGDFGFSIPCSALCIRLKLLSATTSTIIAFIDIC